MSAKGKVVNAEKGSMPSQSRYEAGGRTAQAEVRCPLRFSVVPRLRAEQ